MHEHCTVQIKNFASDVQSLQKRYCLSSK